MERGFIFDLDGVLTDTAEYHYRSWKQLTDEEGIPFTRDDNDLLRGITRRHSLEVILKGKTLPEDQMQDWMRRKNEYFHVFLEEMTSDNLLAGVGDFLESAVQGKIKLGLASASGNARIVCERLGILGLFEAFGDATTVSNPKPAPDLFIWVAGGLGVSPKDCIVFEDATTGIEAALSAGFWTVGIGVDERTAKAHRQIPDFRGVTIADFNLPLTQHK